MGRWVTRGLLSLGVALLVLAVAVTIVLRTSWGHERLRRIAVAQASRFLTGTLEIGSLDGSLLSGVQLSNVRLSRDGRQLVSIDRLTVDYSVRDIIRQGAVIHALELERPRFAFARLPDGRWDIATIVRRNETEARGSGGPAVHIDSIEIRDGSVSLADALSLGAAHVPTVFDRLDARFGFATAPGAWSIDFERLSFTGAAPDLTIEQLRGGLGRADGGWTFRDLHVRTSRSEFTLDGRVDQRTAPSTLALTVDAPRFAFQEWAGVLTGLRNIAVESSFQTRIEGPLNQMQTSIDLHSTGGDVRGNLVLDSTVPGWHGKGTTAVRRLDLARWLNRPDRPSDISGEVQLDLDLMLGRRFPIGSFAFAGSHAGYLAYEADDVVTRGRVNETEVHIVSATATAYGSNVRLTDGRIGITEPYPFQFVGNTTGVDLRQLPASVPVPHVESTLAFEYDVVGQFARPFIRGSATFGDSEFLGARLASGATGTIDTQSTPFRYGGQGTLADVDLNRFGRDLEVDWLADQRYAGTVRGTFHVQGSGADAATMSLEGGGRLAEASVFGGHLSEGDVAIVIADGSLDASFDGLLSDVDPSIPLAEGAYAARLSGQGHGHFIARGLLVRSPSLRDYTIEASLTTNRTTVRGIEIDRGSADVALDGGVLRIHRLDASGPALALEASGPLDFESGQGTRVAYRLTRGDLAKLESVLGRRLDGEVTTEGVLTGSLEHPHLDGEGSVDRVALSGVEALSGSVRYAVTVPVEAPAQTTGTLSARLSELRVLGRTLSTLGADLTYTAGTLSANLVATLPENVAAGVDTTLALDAAARHATVDRLSMTFQQTSWYLADASRPRIDWHDTGFDLSGLELVNEGSERQRLSASGSWNADGGSALRLVATAISLDTFGATSSGPAPIGGTLDATATLTGSRDRPVLSSDFSITDGRVRRLAFTKFAGRVGYEGDQLQVDVRFDQAEGIWATAMGSLPLSVFDRSRPPGSIKLAVRSSQASLALLEGVSDRVRDVRGQMELDVTILGTTQEPLFDGRVNVANAAFQVVSTGARYQNGRMALQLTTDRVSVESFHLEDGDGHPLELTGSLGTHELRVGDLEVDLVARGLEVLRNEYGRISVDAQLRFSEVFESPKVTGRITISGGSVAVDRLLDRVLFQPYATQASQAPELDPIVALNPWERMGMDVELHIPGTLRMIGDNVQVSPGTPLGLGDINLRVFGDLYLYKDPAQPVYVNGSLDSLRGTYAFQGRRFDLEPSSSVNFWGDLNPQLYVTVNRVISGVETRVSMTGPLQQPELRLSSTPPLEPSDILSLIVFNTSSNSLSALQQQQLAVRAGTLAAGFIVAPMVSALERTLGIDTLEIEPGADVNAGPRVTVGNEIAPGLVARFSRQFGEAEYDEATLEYYLSRLFRIRATFSDAGSLTARSPFRRVERAGIDFLLFFSF